MNRGGAAQWECVAWPSKRHEWKTDRHKVKCKGEGGKIPIYLLFCPEDRGRRFQINSGKS